MATGSRSRNSEGNRKNAKIRPDGVARAGANKLLGVLPGRQQGAVAPYDRLGAGMMDLAEAPSAFIRAACVPVDGSWHASGTLDEARSILAAHPQVRGSSIHVAAILGDDAGVRRFLALDLGAATTVGGPYGWDPLTHLCFSRYLRLAPRAPRASCAPRLPSWMRGQARTPASFPRTTTRPSSRAPFMARLVSRITPS
jgi:hypothetical protein